MNTVWLSKNNNRAKNLIVFFAGWSFDEKPFEFLSTDGYDVLFVYDYNDIVPAIELKTLGTYQNKILITWSMGVFAAYKYREIFNDFDLKIAINGTISPVDNEYGIPIKTFELTLKHAAKGLEGKFYKNLFKSPEEFERYMLSPVERSVENRVNELENIYSKIKSSKDSEEKFYDIALVSEFDKIIPPDNQKKSHEKLKIPVKILPFGHWLFYNFNSWDEIVKLCRQI